jgi:hypothetical protein
MCTAVGLRGWCTRLVVQMGCKGASGNDPDQMLAARPTYVPLAATERMTRPVSDHRTFRCTRCHTVQG